MNKYIILLCFMLVVVLNVSTAQVTDSHVWVNEFRYDNLSNFKVDDQNDFVELIVSNELLTSPEAVNYQLVIYTANAFDLDTDDALPGKGLPYSKASILYTDAETFHNLADEDIAGVTGFQRCPDLTGNFTVLTKNMNLMDIPSAFGIIYDDGTNGGVVQLISYERAFKIKNHPDAGPAAGEQTTLLTGSLVNLDGSVTENALTDGTHSIQLRGTGTTYGEFSWSDDPDNFNSACAINSGQTINALPCIAPAINNLGDQSACNAYTLPMISGQFLSTAAAYYTDSQDNSGTEITVSEITSDMTVWMYDDNGCGTSEESFQVTILSGVTLPVFSDVAVCFGDQAVIDNGIMAPAQATLQWQKFNGTTFEDVPNENGTTFTVAQVTSSGTYRLQVDTESGCTVTGDEFMIVANDFEAGAYNGDQTVQSDETPTLFAETTPAMGGDLSYQWQSALANNNFDFADIDGATSATYAPDMLAQTTFFRRITTNDLLGSSCSETGEVVTVEVQQANPLPIRLLSLNAYEQGENNLLTWASATEIDAAGYRVEWSLDGKSFRQLAYVKAEQRASEYAYVHEKPQAGEHYYRLQKVDVTGRLEYSSVVTLQRKDLVINALSVMPNPAKDVVTLMLPTIIDASQSFNMEIYDTNGKLLLQQNVSGQATVSLQFLPEGIYQIIVRQGELQFEAQVVKVK